MRGDGKRAAVVDALTRIGGSDVVVETMYQTGKDLSHLYRETSEGGLAKLYKH